MKKTIDQISPKFRLILLIHKVKKVLTLLANYHVTDCLKGIAHAHFSPCTTEVQ